MSNRRHLISFPTGRAVLAAFAACLSVIPGFAQSHAVSGPGMGLIFDTGTRSLRPVNGIPGSAFLGAPISETLSFATVAPSGKLALGWSDGRASVYGAVMVRLPESTLTEVTHAAWAADMSAVVLYAAGTGQVQRILDPLQAPTVEPAFSIPVGGRVNFLVTHRGLIVVGLEETPINGLYEIGASGARLLAELGQPTAGAFSSAGDSMTVASRATGQIVEYDTREFSVRSTSPVGYEAVSALALSADSKSIYAIRGGVLTVLERGTWRTASELPMEFDASGLTGLAVADVFSLAGGKRPGDPVWIFAGKTQSIYFVPGGLPNGEPEDRQ